MYLLKKYIHSAKNVGASYCKIEKVRQVRQVKIGTNSTFATLKNGNGGTVVYRCRHV